MKAGEGVVPLSEAKELQLRIRKLERILDRMTLENEILKEAVRITLKKTDLAGAVASGGRFPMTAAASTLEVSRSPQYERRKNGEGSRKLHYRKADDEGYLFLIRRITDDRPTHGYRRVTALLNRQLMRENRPRVNTKRCIVHFYRNVFSVVPAKWMSAVAAMLKAIHASEDRMAAIEKEEAVADKLEALKLREAAKKVRESILETFSVCDVPREHRIRIRTNNALERIMKEIRRCTRVVGAFPDGHSALMLCAARLRHVAGTQWGSRRYLNMDLLREQDLEQAIDLADAI